MSETFIDAHHHLWDLSLLPYVWLNQKGKMKPFGDPTPIQRTYDLSELRETDAAQLPLLKSVHLQCDPGLEDPVAETAFVQSVSDASNFPMAIVGFVDLRNENAQEILAKHGTYKNFRGVRQIICRTKDHPHLNFADENLLAKSAWQKNFAFLADMKLSFDLQLYPEQMHEAAEILKDHPEIPVAVNHFGCPFDLGEDGIALWRSGLDKLANLDQVSLKFSGMGMYDRNWNASSVADMFAFAIEIFGTQRLMFGSNFPVDKLMRGYGEIYKDFLSLIANLDAAERHKILVSNAEAFYKF